MHWKHLAFISDCLVRMHNNNTTTYKCKPDLVVLFNQIMGGFIKKNIQHVSRKIEFWLPRATLFWINKPLMVIITYTVLTLTSRVVIISCNYSEDIYNMSYLTHGRLLQFPSEFHVLSGPPSWLVSHSLTTDTYGITQIQRKQQRH